MIAVTTVKPLTAIMVVLRRPIASPRLPKIKAPRGRPISVATKIHDATSAAVPRSSVAGMK